MPRHSADQVTAALRPLLDDLAPAPGDRLPAERRLAARLGCSRATLRAALAALEAEGAIWRHVGQGTFRGPRPRQRPVPDRLLLDTATPDAVMEARLLLEPQVAQTAALRADRADLAHLARHVADCRNARGIPDCEAADDAFHRAIAEVAGNPVVTGFLALLSGTRRRARWQREWDRTYRRLGGVAFRTDHSLEHQAVVDAIGRGDPVAAGAAMRRHLQAFRDAMRACTAGRTPTRPTGRR